MKRKKILYVITKANWGGAQKYVYDLAISLPKEQFDVSVAFGKSGRLGDELEKAGIRTYELSSLQRDVSFGADLKTFFELQKLFNTVRPDIVHLNSSKVAGIGSLSARMAGVPNIIFTAHGWPFWEKRNIFVRAVIWFFSWLTSLLSHTTITISDYDLEVARRMPFVSKKTVRVYNGIAPIDFLPRGSSTNIRVLTNGELNANKNLFTGIDAVARARDLGADITYSIMSDGELRATLEQYITEKNYGSFVSLLGFIPEGKRHYKNFDVFFLPSKKEGLPYVLLEAGLAELPVVASNVGGIPEIIEHEKNGLLYASNDVEGFARALHLLSGSPEMRARFGSALKEKVLRDFSFAQMQKDTVALYR